MKQGDQRRKTLLGQAGPKVALTSANGTCASTNRLSVIGSHPMRKFADLAQHRRLAAQGPGKRRHHPDMTDLRVKPGLGLDPSRTKPLRQSRRLPGPNQSVLGAGKKQRGRIAGACEVHRLG